jgi:hypothetical protein
MDLQRLRPCVPQKQLSHKRLFCLESHPLPEELSQHIEAPEKQSSTPGEKTSYQDFKAGDADPLVGANIKEILIKEDSYFGRLTWTRLVFPRLLG